jgi:hypothetical protein
VEVEMTEQAPPASPGLGPHVSSKWASESFLDRDVKTKEKRIWAQLVREEVERRLGFATAFTAELRKSSHGWARDSDTRDLELNWGHLPNYLGLVTIVTDFYALLLPAFDTTTYWYRPPAGQEPSSNEQMITLLGAELYSDLSAWQTMFYAVVPCCLIYPFLAYWGIKTVVESEVLFLPP